MSSAMPRAFSQGFFPHPFFGLEIQAEVRNIAYINVMFKSLDELGHNPSNSKNKFRNDIALKLDF